MLQPRACARPFFTFQNGSLRMRADSPGSDVLRLLHGRRADAVGQSVGDQHVGDPRCSAHRSCSIECSRSPISARSATSKPVTSACRPR